MIPIFKALYMRGHLKLYNFSSNEVTGGFGCFPADYLSRANPSPIDDSLAYVHLFKAMLRLTSNFCQGNTNTRIYEDVRVFQKYITESCNNMEAIRIFIVVLLLEFVARAYLKRNKIRFSI